MLLSQFVPPSLSPTVPQLHEWLFKNILTLANIFPPFPRYYLNCKFSSRNLLELLRKLLHWKLEFLLLLLAYLCWFQISFFLTNPRDFFSLHPMLPEDKGLEYETETHSERGFWNVAEGNWNQKPNSETKWFQAEFLGLNIFGLTSQKLHIVHGRELWNHLHFFLLQTVFKAVRNHSKSTITVIITPK